MKFLLTMILLFSATFSIPANKAAENVTGKWKVTGEVAGTPVIPVCDMKQDDKNVLTGTCKIMDSELPMKGKVEDKKVTWQFDINYQGNDLTVIFNGTLENDSKMNGKINVQPVSYDGDFTAEKEKAAAEE